MTAVAGDGTNFPAEYPYRNRPGKYPSSRPSCRDISERKRADAAGRYACTRIIADAAVMDQTIPKILQTMCENIGWRLGQMWQMDPKAGLLRCVAVWHEPFAAVTAFADLSRSTTLAPDAGLPGKAWASRKSFWANGAGKGVSLFETLVAARAVEAARCGFHDALAFPILHGEEMLGVMEFFHDNMLEPDEPLLAMIAAVGSQVGQFIEPHAIGGGGAVYSGIASRGESGIGNPSRPPHRGIERRQ